MFGRFTRQSPHTRPLTRRVELDQIHKRIAIHTVQQAQQTNVLGLLPQRK